LDRIAAYTLDADARRVVVVVLVDYELREAVAQRGLEITGDTAQLGGR